MRSPDYDLIIVGGGLAGSSLAISLADRGAKILVVEQQDPFRDRIRGEVLMPWGSLEAKRLDIYDLLLNNCAIEATYYSRSRLGAPVAIRDLLATTPAGTCCITFPHATMQDVLLRHAEFLGTEVRRGAAVASVVPGEPPRVQVGGDKNDLSARLVVLADGRDSRLRSMLPFEVRRDPEQLFIAGMILEGETNCSELLAGDAPSHANTINLFTIQRVGEWSSLCVSRLAAIGFISSTTGM